MMFDKEYCKGCDSYKPLDQFGTDSRRRNNHRKYCKQCTNENNRQYRHDNPEMNINASRKHRRQKVVYSKNSSYLNEYYRLQARRDWLQKKFNISLEDYQKLYHKQNGLCAICNQPETAKRGTNDTRYLAVDHDHITGKVRGLLCMNCNIKLAIVENTSFVDKAHAYLAEYEER